MRAFAGARRQRRRARINRRARPDYALAFGVELFSKGPPAIIDMRLIVGVAAKIPRNPAPSAEGLFEARDKV
jgi:hypothetical protein